MRERPQLGTPYGTDGPWLAAILDVLGDLHDLIDARLPRQEGPVRIIEPAPAAPSRAVPVSEPAPDVPPERAKPVEEPDPDEQPSPDPLPEHPPMSGRGSSAAAWADWARTAGVAVDDGLSRDDIITACRDAGVIE